jgi:NhaP-type Na+/H+ or K+/H+ antiporter
MIIEVDKIHKEQSKKVLSEVNAGFALSGMFLLGACLLLVDFKNFWWLIVFFLIGCVYFLRKPLEQLKIYKKYKKDE